MGSYSEAEGDNFLLASLTRLWKVVYQVLQDYYKQMTADIRYWPSSIR